jgi:hypothetical protein
MREKAETFLFTEEAVKCEKTAEQVVLKVEVKTEVEEDRDQLEHEVRDSFWHPFNAPPNKMVVAPK